MEEETHLRRSSFVSVLFDIKLDKVGYTWIKLEMQQLVLFCLTLLNWIKLDHLMMIFLPAANLQTCRRAAAR